MVWAEYALTRRHLPLAQPVPIVTPFIIHIPRRTIEKVLFFVDLKRGTTDEDLIHGDLIVSTFGILVRADRGSGETYTKGPDVGKTLVVRLRVRPPGIEVLDVSLPWIAAAI